MQAELLDLLRDIQVEFGLGLVFISHDIGLVARIADHVIVMYAGDIVEAGSVQAVLERPSHPYTAMLLNCIPSPAAPRPRAELPTIAGAVPSLDAAITGCAFRDRCPVAEPRCGQPFAARVQDSHRCYCVKPGAMRHGVPA